MLTQWFGTLDFRGAVILGLIVMPFIGVGYVLGMLNMRKNYLNLLRREHINTRHTMRYMEYRADHERKLGYAVGYRMGSQK